MNINVIAVLAMVNVAKVTEGVREQLDHHVSNWDRIFHWKIVYKHVPGQFLVNITGVKTLLRKTEIPQILPLFNP